MAKKLAARTSEPIEVHLFGGPDVEARQRVDLAQGLGKSADQAGLDGAGGQYTPLGILNQARDHDSHSVSDRWGQQCRVPAEVAERDDCGPCRG